ncbi:MAG: hypothetical protein DHS20C13_20090 [Thermodesulfobacteriota bacterium]|nr:MAG: hypothetical protein DHS20C13_20090 [Thermodesulfobacteriota bacterium]
MLLGAFTGNAQTIIFTGDAKADFSGQGVVVLEDGTFQDVGTPPGWPFPASGWDIKKAYFYTNLNQLHIGVEYYGIGGDADGDGDPNNSSTELITRGGQDLPNLANSESIAVAIDLDQDGVFDIIAGVPGGDSGGGSLGCTNYDINDCFGLYSYFPDASVDQLAFRFLSLLEHPITNQNPSISAARPDFEFTIHDWNLISEWGGVEPSTCETFSFDVGLYSGSFQDDGIGEDTMPNASNSATVSLEVCADCEGTIFGNQTVDSCGVCGGDNSTCGVKTINFTGAPEEDFIGDGVFLLSDSVDPNSTPIPDVGVPGQIGSVISGWDIKEVYFFTNIDELYIGVDYFGIAGDADGSNDPGVASPELESIGGQDLPDMAQSETLAIEMDLDQDGVFELIAGVPAGNPVGGTLDCQDFDLNDCIGLYNHSNTDSVSSGLKFESLIDPINSLFALPSIDTPDIEFSIDNWQNVTGWDMLEPNSCETFSFDVRIFSGSFVDAGIGEDFMPNQLDTSTVSLDVCTDCDGIPFGPNVAGECGCGEEEVDENGNGILDCKEVELTVNLMGEGGGSVSSDIPGVDCPGDCSEIYEEGAVVILSAAADDVSQFIGWSGDPDCEDGVITMETDKICEATFSFLSLKLNPIFPSVASNVNSMSVENASPNGAVAFIMGFRNEIADVTIDCGSLELGISPFLLLGVVNAGSDQMANLLFYIGLLSNQNQMFTQAVDLNTCRVSNVVTNLIANN